MTKLTLDQFKSQLAMLLQDIPSGTSADLTDFAIAFWNGCDVTYAFVDVEDGKIEDEFDLDDYAWQQWQPAFSTWTEEPKFSVRREINLWLRDAPPHEAGA